jgi:hypothetical protein
VLYRIYEIKGKYFVTLLKDFLKRYGALRFGKDAIIVSARADKYLKKRFGAGCPVVNVSLNRSVQKISNK